MKENKFLKNKSCFRRIIASLLVFAITFSTCLSLGEVKAYAINYYQYCHLDIRVYSNVTITILNEDGSITTEEVTGTISAPSARIYNTSSTTWKTSDGTENGYSYIDVYYNQTASSDPNNGKYEYASTVGHGKGSALEFYDGDTAVIDYTITYEINGEKHTLNLEKSVVFAEEDNKCASNGDYGKEMRGFDLEISSEEVSSAISHSNMEIQKKWNDNGSDYRPEYIELKVYQTVTKSGSETKSPYMTLKLNKNLNNSTFAMEAGVVQDKDMVVQFQDNYGVSISGLPQNSWIIGEDGNYTYVSCSYSIEEVMANGDPNFNAVYGSLVYLDKIEENSYYFTITNTLAYEKLAVKKEWADSTQGVNHEEDSVQIQLKAYYYLNEEKTEVPNEWLKEFGCSTNVTLNESNDWYAVLGNMPVYYIDDNGNYYPIAGFEVEESEVEGYTAVISEISTEKDSKGNYYFTVTNTPKPKTTSVTVTKKVSGNLGEQSKEFTFSAKIVNSDGTTYIPKGETEEEGGIFKFTLKHDESITFSDVPIGATITITESDADGYTVFANDNKLADGSYTTEIAETEMTINFVNNKDVLIDTGVFLDSIPYIFIIGIVGTIVVIAMVKKNRHHEV